MTPDTRSIYSTQASTDVIKAPEGDSTLDLTIQSNPPSSMPPSPLIPKAGEGDIVDSFEALSGTLVTTESHGVVPTETDSIKTTAPTERPVATFATMDSYIQAIISETPGDIVCRMEFEDNGANVPTKEQGKRLWGYHLKHYCRVHKLKPFYSYSFTIAISRKDAEVVSADLLDVFDSWMKAGVAPPKTSETFEASEWGSEDARWGFNDQQIVDRGPDRRWIQVELGKR